MSSYEGAVAATGGADRFLKRSGRVWFVLAAIGQAAFIYFILAYFGARTVAGDYAAWNDKPLITGHVAGDAAGNVVFITHVLLAAVITFGGLLQLVPQVRSAAPVIHRWNGRLFMVVAYFMAVSGLWLVFVRGTSLSAVSSAGTTLNAILICVFATLAWRAAIARRFDEHRKWAMRTFLMVNGVWFLRVAMMGWVLLTGGAGMNRTMSGPADSVIVFACYLVPLGLLELYFRAQRTQRPSTKYISASAIAFATAFMAAGIFGTIAFMWRPYI